MLIVLFYTIKYLAIAYVVLFFLLSLSGNNSTKKKNRIIFTTFIAIFLLLYELYNYLYYGTLPVSELIVYIVVFILFITTLGIPLYGIYESQKEKEIKTYLEWFIGFSIFWIIMFDIY
jgi:hypothetical protein